ncbi:MAG: bifunctional N-acetylglucosamine-1-phosphate uridyltransferase/glucosamine-1-phosphate acetyltransferase [Rhodospirillaceae bacterium]|nr:bifunctional N-acetylglucosamine-1-phosphate uridyltransferase/glucosamine-1-phosphate acetyltransferase [Rhodospirillaceae bacterium]MDG1888233.1 bifunctional UDP-N-acetylglucosamine diphosphorylase/glucosamine-1-phosphate N-acetyltransferase GlmU [Alphaproteobacteria bacterium]
MPHSLSVLVLAAGKGTRMNSQKPKVLHEIAGLPLVCHVIEAIKPLEPDNLVVVIAPDQEEIRGVVSPASIRIQEKSLGTGDAVKAGLSNLKNLCGTVLVAFGADPMITTSTLKRLISAREVVNPPDVVVLGFRTENPDRYGRLVLDTHGKLERIVEVSEAHTIDKPVELYNAGVMAVNGAKIIEFLEALSPENGKKEYYLTDIVRIALKKGGYAKVVEGEEEETLGVDSRADLAKAEAMMQVRLRMKMLNNGVTLVSPETTFLSHDTRIGRDTTIHPNVVIGKNVDIGESVEIKSFSHLEGATVSDEVVVGPYARLRPGTEIERGAKVGNFVEIKKAKIGKGTKVNHLSYVGDANVGQEVNIGAGTITCNFDGFKKHLTVIGDRAFIGSNTSLIAPVEVGENAIIGAGSTVTTSVDDNAISVVRGELKEIPNGAARFRTKRQRAWKKN